MENELEVVNIRLVKEPSLYSEQTLDSPQAVVELLDAQLPRRKDVECDRKDGPGEIEEKRIRSFYLLYYFM